MKQKRQRKSGSETRKKRGKKKLAPISLAPMDMETAIKAAIATGPITDPSIKKRRR